MGVFQSGCVRFTFTLVEFSTPERDYLSPLCASSGHGIESLSLPTAPVSDDCAQFRRSVVESVCQRSIVISAARTCHRGLVVSFSRFTPSPFFVFLTRMLARRGNIRSPRECTTVASFSVSTHEYAPFNVNVWNTTHVRLHACASGLTHGFALVLPRSTRAASLIPQTFFPSLMPRSPNTFDL